ncbi:MAG: hypothetical protein A2023_00590 [Sulfuricurvum sp. GWF2_44_89]|uniref:Uncharacterized protein n=2 Tax=Sulfurimonadaceae TaxID=2771471 RepID=A0A2D3WJL8_9BACT|nr:MAG: hypothetical protein A2023_00590 [Sulfuricurvum sp. GWF2_44_89]OHD94440.1 MAG: hypothetical protein A2517_09790 [Sulfuricurvum sp. RIFOXYD12_FULL_44_77]OHD98813.1 MAG: hypothetical protein A2552_03080 [Sulfuricurvum sp. RIFOXYD2_FULL_44_160]DAB38486.1 MAG TPA: hypothetical protein CFH83_05765 [Sulfuricurvum kujiense]
MGLKKILLNFCEIHEIKDLSCILHFTLLNYVANLSKKQPNVNLSPKVIDGFSGIGEEKAFQLLTYLSEHSDLIQKYYVFKCTDDIDEISESLNAEDIDDDTNIQIYGCLKCNQNHVYSLSETQFYEIGFNAKREEVINQLNFNSADIFKEMIVLNTNEEHIDRLANILTSKLKLSAPDQEQAKQGMIKYLHSVKSFSSVIASISGDLADTTGNIKKMAEDVTGFSTIYESIKGLLGNS